MEIIKRIDKNGKAVYTIKKDGRYVAIKLHEFEIDLLEQLVKFIHIRSNNVIDYFVALRALNGFDTGNELRNRNNASNRLVNLKKSGLIKSKVPDILGAPFLYELNIYTFSKRTLELLLQLNRLNEQQVAYYLAVLKKTSSYKELSTHHVAIYMLGYQIDLLLKKEGLNNTDYVITRGSIFPLFKNTKRTTYTIYPDLVLYIPDLKKFVAFEIDGGKQQKNIIEDKYKRYKQLADKMDSDETLHVVFVPIDAHLIPNKGLGLKSLRIKHLKKCIPLSEEWTNNLHVFAMNSRAVIDYVKNMLSFYELFSKRTIKLALQSFSMAFNDVLKTTDYTVKAVQLSTTISQIALDYTVLTIEKQNKIVNRYMIIYMNTGSIEDHQVYIEICNVLKNYNRQNSGRFNLILIYKSKSARELDTLGVFETNKLFDIVAASLDAWQIQNKESAGFYKQNRKNLSFDIPLTQTISK